MDWVTLYPCNYVDPQSQTATAERAREREERSRRWLGLRARVLEVGGLRASGDGKLPPGLREPGRRGLDPDEVAQALRYRSGDALVTELGDAWDRFRDSRSPEHAEVTVLPPGTRFRISTKSRPGEFLQGRAVVRTYASVIEDYRYHPEPKSLGPDGRPCARDTLGVLQRRPVVPSSVHFIGKESNKLDEVQSGLIHSPESAVLEFQATDCDRWARVVLPVMQSLGVGEVVARTGLPERTVRAALGGRRPSASTRDAIEELAT